MLLLVRNQRSSCSLIDFVNQMKKGGLYVLGQVTVGSLSSCPTDPLAEKSADWLSLIDHLKVKAFVELTMSSTIRRGVEQLMRVSGIGAMKPNTVLLGFYDDTSHLDDLTSLGSPFYNAELGRMLDSQIEERMSPEEFVGIIEDTLKLQKNVCLCRNFQSLDRTEVFSSETKFRKRAGRKKYLDVWPVNFLSPAEETDLADNTSLFMFQLSCIVNMVPKWRSHQLRVFMCVGAGDNNISSKEQELQKLLEMLRIKAETSVLLWDHLASMTGESEEGSVSSQYLTAVNEFIRVKCSETAVSFIYLPPPPASPSDHPHYLQTLDELSRNLPPTILVHGVSPVVTTTL